MSDLLSILNTMFKDANKYMQNGEFLLANKKFKSILCKIPEIDLIKNIGIYRVIIDSALKLGDIKQIMGIIGKIVLFIHENTEYKTVIWSSLNKLSSILKIEDYDKVMSRYPIVYNNLCGHDDIDHTLMKKIINNMENDVDKAIFQTHVYLNLSKRYLFNDDKIVENISDCLTIAEKASVSTSQELIDFENIFRKPILYPLSYLHVNNRSYLERLSNIYRKTNNCLNYVSDRCKENRIIERKRIRVGFISITFMSMLSSVFRDRSNIIKFMSSSKFEKILIVQKKICSNIKSKQVIDVIEGVHNMVDKVVELPNILENSKDFMKTVADLELDVLVYCDIGMATESVIMAHARLAPVQINTWGHSITSGISTLDYYISSKLYEVDDLDVAQTHYSEKLIALDSLCTSYFKIMFNIKGFKTRKEIGLPENKHILFCMQNSFKINIPFITSLYDNVYSKRQDYILLMLDMNLSKDHHDFIKNKYGEGFYSTLMFIPKCQTEKFHNYLYLSDLSLDTYPFCGCNTSLEAFMYGKIVITRPSEYLAGRFTYGFYKKMNILDPVVYNYDDYFKKVNYYMDNKQAKLELEERIINNRECLYGDKDSIIEWENTITKLALPYIKEMPEKYQLNNVYNVDPLDLLSPQRFDILFKYMYVKYKSQWALDYYCEHIRVLNGGYDMVTEVQETEKNSVDEFSRTFKVLIDDIEKDKINDPVPVNSVNDSLLYPLNGSHRIGIALGLNKGNIHTIVKSKSIKMPFGYPSHVFKNRNNFTMPTPGKDVKMRMSQEMINYATLEYVKLKKGKTRIMTIFSKSNKTQEVIDTLISFQVSIVSYSEFTLTADGCYNLIKEMYLDESFVNIDLKTKECFPETNGGRIGIIVLEADPEKLIHLSQSGGKYKTKIRDIYGSHHSIHVTDNNNDTERIANTLLHKNSWSFLNYQKRTYSDNMKELFKKYRKTANDNQCIVSSYIMGLYSLREPADLDFISIDNKKQGTHNKYVDIYPKTFKEIINNPANYFYFHGLKCCTLDIIKQMKHTRNEIPKDIKDIELISSLSTKKTSITRNPTAIIDLDMSILRKALSGECKINNSPFPHIIIHNALPDELYKQLEIEYPQIEYFDGPPPMKSNVPIIKNCDTMLLDDRISPLWKKFIGYHSSYAFLNDFKKVFQYELVKRYPHLLTSFKNEYCSPGNKGKIEEGKDFIINCQNIVNTPVFTDPHINHSYPQINHSDNHSLFTGFLYFPVLNDKAGGNHQLYQIDPINQKSANTNTNTNTNAKVNTVIPYKPNTVILFLNTDHSIYNSAPRKSTMAYRRLTTFNTDYKNKLFNTIFK
jgi:predicted O-linked N-acetylglucosamine transferase (SPINDLY family)